MSKCESYEQCGKNWDRVGELAGEKRQLQARIAELEAALSWVSVDERLPEDDDLVIVAGGVARYSDGVWRTLTGYPYPGAVIQWEVTHWKPLPPEPQS